MRNTAFVPLALIALCGLMNRTARADGGQVRLSERHGGVQIAVFTAPSPLRAGPVDVSVCIQEAASGRTLLDVPISIEVCPRDGAQPALRKRATTRAATNKLFKAAEFEMSSPGWWDVRVECDLPPPEWPFVARFTIEAGPPRPAWLTIWPWYGWPFAVVALFVVHRLLVCRHNTRRRQFVTSSGPTIGAS